MNPKLSIITINYNNAAGLEKTIRSVIKQDYKNFEFIIVDGASTDGSLEVIERFREQIHIPISEEDTGIYNAMNKGIAVSKGEYLLFLNSGDVLSSSKALYEFIDHPLFEGDIVYGDYQFENGEKRYPDVLPPDYFMRTSLPHQSTLFKKTLFDTMGGYDEKYRIGADRAFYVKCQEAGNVHFQHIPIALTLFDLSGMSNDAAFLQRKQEEDIQLLREGYGDLYEGYKLKLETERRLKTAQRNSVKGIIKRIGKRIERIWKRRS